MPIKVFAIPVLNSESAEAELNQFLRTHVVLSIEQRLVEAGPSSFWTFCITYNEPGAAAAAPPGSGRRRGSTDYREVLNQEDFALFAKLRELRKGLAQAEGVPVYAIFNNEQLAEMVQKRARTRADLDGIAGVGDARIEKYGARFLEFLAQQQGPASEESGKPV